MSNKLRIGVLAAAALALGSSTASATSPPADEGGGTIAVVTHGQAADPFWSVFKRGVDDAAAQMGVTANYSAPATFDMVEMASLIDAAVATGPDGLVVSVPDYPALQDSLAAANEAGIPIITVNSGSDHYQEIGAITHIGQDEIIAGRGGRGTARRGRGHARAVHPPRAGQRSPSTPAAQVPGRRWRRLAARWRSSRSTSTTPPGSPAPSAQRCRPTTRSMRSWPSARRHRRRRWPPSRSSACSGRCRSPRSTSAPTSSRRSSTATCVRHRPAAVPAGLPADRLPQAVSSDNLNTVGGGLPVLHGSWLRHRRERRAGARADRRRFSLTNSLEGEGTVPSPCSRKKGR